MLDQKITTRRDDAIVVEKTDVLPVNTLAENVSDKLRNSKPGGQSLCGTTRLFSVFNTRARVDAFPDESAANASDGQAATLSTTTPYRPDKRHKAGVG